MKLVIALLFFIFFVQPRALSANTLMDVIQQIKPSIVGIGFYSPLSQPRAKLTGTGFVVGDGSLIATNYHVIQDILKPEKKEGQSLVVFVGKGAHANYQQVTLVNFDKTYDLALLRLADQTLAPVTLYNDNHLVAEGSEIALTGFPMGFVLGLYPVTHRGIVSSHSPLIIPLPNSGQLTAAAIKRLKDPYLIYQLDATVYPGNSGSPVYLSQSGEVIAVVNKTFVQGNKENLLKEPSGMTYAIPIKHLKALLAKANKSP
ncbi:S1 family peptidase [Gayadomonas joobiniege]|uniref:S1 family peptidase n=1 Tax=Gayadomonas joobiniege TaxID=1234606 RepID=UPI000370843B|nr:serine protease [Gayadomonas joobiniege]